MFSSKEVSVKALQRILSMHIQRGALEDVEIGIKINRDYINNIMYAEDPIVMAERAEDKIY